MFCGHNFTYLIEKLFQNSPIIMCLGSGGGGGGGVNVLDLQAARSCTSSPDNRFSIKSCLMLYINKLSLCLIGLSQSDSIQMLRFVIMLTGLK